MPDGVCKSPSNDNMIKKIKVIPVWFLLYRLGMLLDWPCPFWRTFWCLSQHHDMKWKGCTWLWNRHQCLMLPSILKRPVSKARFPYRQLMSVARSRWSCFFHCTSRKFYFIFTCSWVLGNTVPWWLRDRGLDFCSWQFVEHKWRYHAENSMGL